ncbi:uncharacterized protein LOC131224689 [Magnolia sinica]|uniref:uncharacterized protein LOC131224689 n=1 Tax=Magnolia sinica TaxID=86752 RepID=UPI002659473F|nr:uncharacterized protein LOC131224689 [Magnolia sinica]
MPSTCKDPLHGFAGERVISEGAISLPVTVGEGQHQVTLMVDFLVVNVPSVHNDILGRPSLNVMRAVVSTYHLMMKFPAEGRIGYLRENSSIEDLEKVSLDEADPSKTIQLGTSLSSEQRSEMLTFLWQHTDVFAWSHADMPGNSLDILVHSLNVDPDHKPVKQKRRPFDAERYEAIADEVFILLDVGFIEEACYPD